MQSVIQDTTDSMTAPLNLGPRKRRPWLRISLFWRTFFLLGVLLAGSAIGWYQLYRTVEYEPRIIDNARQIASLVNLTRAALAHSDSIARVSLIKTLAEQEKVRILPREPDDHYQLLRHDELHRRIAVELISRLGPNTVVASQVNEEPGLWVGFSISDDPYWLLMDSSRVRTLLAGPTWLIWLAALGALSLLGAAVLARLINQPLKHLSAAVGHVSDGNYQLAHLDERVRSSEVREVNIGFNRMAEQLSRIEQERTEMLAGISHDLRTPLARLRLESEMSVPDADARENMAADIAQVDSVISKFLDYARPDHVSLQALPLAPVVVSSARPFMNRDDIHLKIEISPSHWVMGDEIELARVMGNLLENARRYGASPEDGITRVQISSQLHERWIILRVRDGGQGVTAEQQANLTRPFYRGDAARTSATGAGMGLSIVAKMIEHMDGTLEFRNSSRGGLLVTIGLRRATPPHKRDKFRRTLPPPTG